MSLSQVRLLVVAVCVAVAGESAMAQIRSPSPPSARPLPPNSPILPPGANAIPPNTVVVPWGYGNICSNEWGWCDLPAPQQINTGCACLTATNQQMGGIVRVMYVEGPTSPYLRPHQLQQPPR